MKPKLTDEDFETAAIGLRCEVALVKAVTSIEAPEGFDAKGRPIILFEGHHFSKHTNGRFDKSHPTLSYPKWTNEFYTKDEHARLARAVELDRDAALKSTSWGRFQILGVNYEACGFSTLQAFINAMFDSEFEHLSAFVRFVKSKGLDDALREKRWDDFARGYNGPAYAKHGYHTRLEKAYRDVVAKSVSP
jgi:hypothetical protein